MTTENRGELVLRVVPRLTEINSNGHIFGGWILSQMDLAGGIVAGRLAGGAVATVAIDGMKFISPMLVGDVVAVYAREERRGRTSIGIRVDVIASRGRDQQQVDLTSGLFTFVALDEQHRPRMLPED